MLLRRYSHKRVAMKSKIREFFKDVFVKFCVLFTITFCINLLLDDFVTLNFIFVISAALLVCIKLIDRYLK